MLKDIIVSQQRELEDRIRQRYVKRQLAVPLGDNDLIRVVLGPRRCGKSFLAMHLIAGEDSRGYVNFDDERLTDLQDYDGLIAAVDSADLRPVIAAVCFRASVGGMAPRLSVALFPPGSC